MHHLHTQKHYTCLLTYSRSTPIPIHILRRTSPKGKQEHLAHSLSQACRSTKCVMYKPFAKTLQARQATLSSSQASTCRRDSVPKVLATGFNTLDPFT